ncbi:MAG: cupin domain-containing protein [bacterium]|nr:cupin domain-containing protein [bacterium]
MANGNLNVSDIGDKLKFLREERRLSMRELASQSGVSASLISKIEAGKVSPTVMSLQKLLESMNVDLFKFFIEETDINPTDQIVFKKSSMISTKDAEHTWYYAFPKHPDIKAELLYEEYQPHTKIVEKESHKGDIIGYVVSGELTLKVNGKGTFKVQAGDAFYIKTGQPHTARNDGDTVLTLVSTRLMG